MDSVRLNGSNDYLEVYWEDGYFRCRDIDTKDPLSQTWSYETMEELVNTDSRRTRAFYGLYTILALRQSSHELLMEALFDE